VNKALILGGGPAGTAAAYYLKKQGLSDITIVEKDKLGGLARTRVYENIPYEYGPQILYTEEDKLQNVFEEFLTLYHPPTSNKKFSPALSINGKIDEKSLHSFPVTIENVLKMDNPTEVIKELYNVNLEKPDFSNFENYVISRMGRSIYELYIKNYNIKQWKIEPKNMEADWAKFRPLTLKSSSTGMFKSSWQGHPGDYNPLWTGMTKDCKIQKGTAAVSEDFQQVTIDGDRVDADIIVSTLPLSENLDFIHTCLVYVSIKCEGFVMPSYATSFPNTYDFVRIMEYKQQFFVESEYTLLDFQFSWKDVCETDKYIEQVRYFVKNILKKEIADLWVETKKNIYPVSTAASLKKVEHQLSLASKSKVIPMGRLGVHAYVSKDTCILMGIIMSDNFEDVISGDPSKKINVLKKMRNKLS